MIIQELSDTGNFDSVKTWKAPYGLVWVTVGYSNGQQVITVTPETLDLYVLGNDLGYEEPTEGLTGQDLFDEEVAAHPLFCNNYCAILEGSRTVTRVADDVLGLPEVVLTFHAGDFQRNLDGRPLMLQGGWQVESIGNSKNACLTIPIPDVDLYRGQQYNMAADDVLTVDTPDGYETHALQFSGASYTETEFLSEGEFIKVLDGEDIMCVSNGFTFLLHKLIS